MMRVWLPQFKHVTTTWGSLFCFTLTRQLTPWINRALHFRQVRRRNSNGNRILAAMAIRRADKIYCAASFGSALATFWACSKRTTIRCRAICLMLVSFIASTKHSQIRKRTKYCLRQVTPLSVQVRSFKRSSASRNS